MPTQKPKKIRERKPPAEPPVQKEEPTPRKTGTGRSGRGADSALEHLIAQEKVRTRKPDNNNN